MSAAADVSAELRRLSLENSRLRELLQLRDRPTDAPRRTSMPTLTASRSAPHIATALSRNRSRPGSPPPGFESGFQAALPRRRFDSLSFRNTAERSPRGPVREPRTSQQRASRARALSHLRESKIISELVHLDMSVVASLLEPVYFEAGELVAREGEVGTCCFVVEEGELEVVTAAGEAGGADGDAGGASAEAGTRLGPGSIFGELCAICETRLSATVRSVGPSSVWTLSLHDLESALREKAEASRSEIFIILRSAASLRPLDDHAISLVADACEVVRFEAGMTVVQEGEQGHAMYVVRSGTLVVTKRQRAASESGGSEASQSQPSSPTVDAVRRRKSCEGDAVMGRRSFRGSSRKSSFLGVIQPGGYFGERSLLTDTPRSATVEAVVDTECLMITRSAFQKLLGPFHTYLEQNLPDDGDLGDGDGVPSAPGDEGARAAAGAGAAGSSLGAWDAPAHEDLSIVKPLGCGSSGSVALVEHAASCRLFALKAVNKTRLQRPGDVERLRSEKAALRAAGNHPCIVQLHATYQDASTLCLLLEPCCGGELYGLIHDNGRLEEAQAKFYASAAVLALQRIHAVGFVYRDLKPENLMIDAQGFPRLCDFGLAKRLSGDARAYSSVGTLEYMAPEVLKRTGHSFAADWWSLGVLIFEMLVGRTPFLPPEERADTLADEEEGAMQLMKDVMACRIYWPEPAECQLSQDATALITGLLRVNLADRIGGLHNGVRDIMDHPWFEGVDFRAIMVRSITPPYRPELESPIDTSCFDVDLGEFAQRLQGDVTAPVPAFAHLDDW